MYRRAIPLALAALVSVTGAALAQEGTPAKPAANRRNFVSCPIVRDTKTVPCWLAESNGELYFLGIQEDIGAAWFPPQLNHQVLVEGTISDEPRVCGGIVLKPLVTSVLPELDTSCNTILPAEDRYEVHGHRGPGPSTEQRARPAAGSAPPAPPAPARASGPFGPKDFVVTFDFDNDFMPGRVTRVISEAIRYVKASNAKTVKVRGYRATTLLSDGRPLVENAWIAERRARKLQDILLGLGMSASALDVSWQSEPEAGDGINDPSKRRVVISVAP